MSSWTPLMEIGIDVIDDLHRELLRRLDEVGRAMKRGGGREHTEGFLAFLELHSQRHFGVEEELMARFRFPALDEHEAMHKAFQRELKTQVETYNRNSDGGASILQIHGWVMKWFSEHEISADAAFGDYVEQASAEQGCAVPGEIQRRRRMYLR